MSKIYHYFVEGDCEKKFIDIFKMPKYGFILPGSTQVFNFINEEISDLRIMQLNPNTHIILVYDTDIENTHMLDKNIRKLNKHGFQKIYHVQSIKNFEDEIVFSSNIKNINSLFSTSSKNEFKRTFCKANNQSLFKKLKSINFNFKAIWSRQDNNAFKKYSTTEGTKLIKRKSK